MVSKYDPQITYWVQRERYLYLGEIHNHHFKQAAKLSITNGDYLISYVSWLEAIGTIQIRLCTNILDKNCLIWTWLWGSNDTKPECGTFLVLSLQKSQSWKTKLSDVLSSVPCAEARTWCFAGWQERLSLCRCLERKGKTGRRILILSVCSLIRIHMKRMKLDLYLIPDTKANSK